MNCAFIFTLGFDEKFIIRALLRNKLKEGDKIILITSGKDERTKKAYESIRNFVSAYNNKIEVKLEEINPKDVINSIKKVIKLFKSLSRYNLVVNISGGMRIICYIVLISCMMMNIENIKIEIELEDFSGVVEIPSLLLKLPKIELSKEKALVLKEILDGKTSVNELLKSLNKDETTIRRHIHSLEELRLIKIKKRKPLEFEAVEGSELLVVDC